MEVSAIRYSAGVGLHGRSPLLRLQSDERLVALTRRGNSGAFEALVGRYHARLLAFCRHLLGSREDAEDVLQEVLAAAYNAMIADERPINVRPWLYRIARNRSLNHMRRVRAIGVDSMDVHLSEHGATTADKVHEREEFRLLVDDIQGLAETQRTALVLREMDALSYDQIAEAMETTVPAVKSLLVRARVSLAESAEARALSCEQVRQELGAVAEGLMKRPGSPVRRHLRGCERCNGFQKQLRATNRALALVLPIGPLVAVRRLVLAHLGLGHSAGSGATAASSLASGGAAAGGSGVAVGSSGGFIGAGVGAIATKAAAGFAAAALVTAGAVEVSSHHPNRHATASAGPTALAPSQTAAAAAAAGGASRPGAAARGTSSTRPSAAAQRNSHVQVERERAARKHRSSRAARLERKKQTSRDSTKSTGTQTSTTSTTATSSTTTTTTSTTTTTTSTTTPTTTTTVGTVTTPTTTTPSTHPTPQPVGTGAIGASGAVGASSASGGASASGGSDVYSPPPRR